MTYFGHYFGHFFGHYIGHDLLWSSRFWPRPSRLWSQPLTWPMLTDFGRARPILANFGHPPWLGRFWPRRSRFWWPCRVWWGQADLGGARSFSANGPPIRRTPSPPDRNPPDRPPPESPKFRAFFSFSRSHFHLFFSLWGSSRVFFLSGGLLVECWWCFGRSGPSNVLVFALGMEIFQSPRRNSRFKHGSVNVHNIFAYLALSLRTSNVHGIEERCWFSQIDFFIEYIPHRINVLFLSSQFDVIHIHIQE